MQQTQKQTWHVASWGFWGWAETVVKLVGIFAGFLAFFGSLSADGFIVGGNPRLAAVLLVGFLALGFVTAVPYLRFQQREVISFIFVVLNGLGHLGLLIALLRQPQERTLPIIFAAAFVIGELVKQRFLAVSGYTEMGQSAGSMINFSRGVMGIYIVLIVLLVI